MVAELAAEWKSMKYSNLTDPTGALLLDPAVGPAAPPDPLLFPYSKFLAILVITLLIMMQTAIRDLREGTWTLFLSFYCSCTTLKLNHARRQYVVADCSATNYASPSPYRARACCCAPPCMLSASTDCRKSSVKSTPFSRKEIGTPHRHWSITLATCPLQHWLDTWSLL